MASFPPVRHLGSVRARPHRRAHPSGASRRRAREKGRAQVDRHRRQVAAGARICRERAECLRGRCAPQGRQDRPLRRAASGGRSRRLTCCTKTIRSRSTVGNGATRRNSSPGAGTGSVGDAEGWRSAILPVREPQPPRGTERDDRPGRGRARAASVRPASAPWTGPGPTGPVRASCPNESLAGENIAAEAILIWWNSTILIPPNSRELNQTARLTPAPAPGACPKPPPLFPVGAGSGSGGDSEENCFARTTHVRVTHPFDDVL